VDTVPLADAELEVVDVETIPELLVVVEVLSPPPVMWNGNEY